MKIIRKVIMKFLFLVMVLLAGTAMVSVNTAYGYTQEEIDAARAWLSGHGYSPDMAGAQQAYADYQAGRIDINGNAVNYSDSSGSEAEALLDSAGSEDSSGSSNEDSGEDSDDSGSTSEEDHARQADAASVEAAAGAEIPSTSQTPAADTVTVTPVASVTAGAEDSTPTEKNLTSSAAAGEEADDRKTDTDVAREKTTVGHDHGSMVGVALAAVALLAVAGIIFTVRNSRREKKREEDRKTDTGM